MGNAIGDFEIIITNMQRNTAPAHDVCEPQTLAVGPMRIAVQAHG
ncbi:hypothetical protein Pla52n_41940 [Stieleria varia]|uniref:Uncharacterized protein n=1 Tax=Stieleria varia TaxID=2528005 RepID=A0A5C6ALB5_9BACT|nr:hypothetical protein Pla52n_41940 [Stieleria varia]